MPGRAAPVRGTPRCGPAVHPDPARVRQPPAVPSLRRRPHIDIDSLDEVPPPTPPLTAHSNPPAAALDSALRLLLHATLAWSQGDEYLSYADRAVRPSAPIRRGFRTSPDNPGPTIKSGGSDSRTPTSGARAAQLLGQHTEAC